jgi:hypothetical protein
VNGRGRIALAALSAALVTGSALWFLGGDDLADGEESVPPTPASGPSALVATVPDVPNGQAVTEEPAERVWDAANVRDLLPVAPANAATVARRIPPLPAYDEALALLAPILELRDGDPDNGWAIAHGILARGLQFRLSDGREAVPHLFSSFAEARPVGSLVLVGFPAEHGGQPVEPHSDLLLKNLAEVGLRPDASFPVAAGTVTAADLYRWTMLKTWLRAEENQSSYQSPSDMPWGLQALATWAPDKELRWKAENGTAMTLGGLTDFVVVALTRESKFMFDAMRADVPFERKGQPLFSYACGGAHMVQGASYAVARGFGRPEDRKAIEAQVPLLFYRLPTELRIYDEAMRRNSKFRTKLLVQRLKFLGHWLETISKLQIEGFFTPDDRQLQTIEGAAQNLTLVVKALADQGTFEQLDALRAEDNQLYLDVAGDSAHAVRGLELALGRQTLAL